MRENSCYYEKFSLWLKTVLQYLGASPFGGRRHWFTLANGSCGYNWRTFKQQDQPQGSNDDTKTLRLINTSDPVG